MVLIIKFSNDIILGRSNEAGWVFLGLNLTRYSLTQAMAEVYLEHSWTSTMELFCKNS